ncbi:MAG: replication protein [Firmicutes bacterium]|nr:replication protein [Bacillota bacterium]
MASPHLDNGYTKVINELFEAIYSYGFNGTELSIVCCVIRFTYGYKDRDNAELSVTFLSNAIKTSIGNIKKTLKKLEQDNVIIVVRENTHTKGRFIKLNIDYDEWAKNKMSGTQKDTTEQKDWYPDMYHSGTQTYTTASTQLGTTSGIQLGTQQINKKETTTTYKQNKEPVVVVKDFFSDAVLHDHSSEEIDNSAIDLDAINQMILKYFEPKTELTRANLQSIANTQNFSMERLESILKVLQLQNGKIGNIVGMLISSIRNPKFDLSKVEAEKKAIGIESIMPKKEKKGLDRWQN